MEQKLDLSSTLPQGRNKCLNCNPIPLQLIPNLLLRFRNRKYDVSADIEKAFLQNSVREVYRNFLYFQWWAKDGNLRTFRHKRVVFGVVNSSCLFVEVIKFHLPKNSENTNCDADLINKLRNSFYVDNVLASVLTMKKNFQVS